MTTSEWQAAAMERLTSGRMTDSEWQSVLDALLSVSESKGIEEFDDHVTAIHKENSVTKK